MSVILLALSFSIFANASQDFKLEVTLHQGEIEKVASITSAKGVCSSANGSETKLRDAKLCDELAKEVARDSKSYTNMPWINSPHVAYFSVHYKSGSQEWERETGVKPDPKAKNREALRKLAVRLLDVVK